MIDLHRPFVPLVDRYHLGRYLLRHNQAFLLVIIQTVLQVMVLFKLHHLPLPLLLPR